MEREWDKGKGNGHRFHQFKFFGAKTICTFCNARFGLLACWTEPNGQLGWSGYLNVTSGFISPCAQLSADETSWVSCFWSSQPVVASEAGGESWIGGILRKVFRPIWLFLSCCHIYQQQELVGLGGGVVSTFYTWASVVVFVYVFVFVFVFLICICNRAGGSGYASDVGCSPKCQQRV